MPTAKLAALLSILAGIALVVVGAMLPGEQLLFYALAVLFFAAAIMMIRKAR